MRQEQLTLALGTTVRGGSGERYVIEGLLGKGGFGAVYLVRDRRVKQQLFALKEVVDPNKRDRERFLFEGEVLKRLDHRALPRVYRVFERAELKRVYILMDYIQGRDLEALRQEQPEQRFSLPLVLALMAPVVDALIYLHRQDPPIVHRDIKPANIIVPVGAEEAVLVDFGSAKEYVADATTSVIRHGSPGYAALEQYGSGTNPRTDIYGLGAALYTLLTGTIPPDAIARAAGSKGFDPLELANLIAPEVPWAVAQAIERAMSISSDGRFETVEAFWQELTVLPTQQPVRIPRVTSVATPQPLTLPDPNIESMTTASPQNQSHAPRLRKGNTLLSIILAILIALVIGTGFLTSLARNSHPPSARVSTPSLATTTPQSLVTSPASSTSTLTPGSSIYPTLAASYAGTISDLLTNTKTSMFLTNIQQSQGNIRGSFQGLGLVGPFKGTVTPSGHIQFTMTIYSGSMTLAFEGTIKIGGDMVGTFKVLDQSGHFTGESGLWNVASGP